MDIEYFKILRGTVGQWMEPRFWRPRRFLFEAHQQHLLVQV